VKKLIKNIEHGAVFCNGFAALHPRPPCSPSLSRLYDISESIGTEIHNLVTDAKRDMPDYLLSDFIEKFRSLSPEDRKSMLAKLVAFIDSR
jgi:hypothetical protein